MRLTLRTMLAYLDDVLDPADAQELGRRISESEFASELVHRVRSSTRKMRLAVPEIDEQGVGVELNSVAEYLDNTLPEEQFSDFEQVCLESDVHLAEVASCHHILTLVLGSPAVVTDEVRQRVYRVDAEHGDGPSRQEMQPDPLPPSRAESSGSDHTRGERVKAPPIVDEKQRDEERLPEFLQPRRGKRLWHIAVIGVVAASLLLVVTGMLLFPGIRQQLGWQEDPASQVAQQPTANEADAARGGSVQAPDQGSSASAIEASREIATAVTGSPAKPSPDAESQPGISQDVSASSPAETETVTSAVQSTGKLVTADQLLLRWQPTQQHWERVSVDTPLKAGEQLLVPPGFRPQMVLYSGLRMTVVGHSAWQWVPMKAAAPRLDLLYGRFIFHRTGKLPETVSIKLGERHGRLQLPGEKSQVALEAWHYLPPGKDPRKETCEIAVQVYQSWGGVWAEQQTASPSEESSDILFSRALGQQAFQQMRVENLPAWTTPADLQGSFEASATVELAGLVRSEQSLLPQLQEQQANHRLHEVRALATRLLAVLGDYDTILGSFHDKSYRASWEKHLKLLQDLVAHDVETAEQVQMALERQRDEDANRLFRMLWDYDSDQLEAESGRELVQWLSDEAIDIRVLAFLNLKRITGKTQVFFPEKPIAQHSTAIRGWKRLLEEGAIIYAQEPTPWRRRPEQLNP